MDIVRKRKADRFLLGQVQCTDVKALSMKSIHQQIMELMRMTLYFIFCLFEEKSKEKLKIWKHRQNDLLLCFVMSTSKRKKTTLVVCKSLSTMRFLHQKMKGKKESKRALTHITFCSLLKPNKQKLWILFKDKLHENIL